MLKIFKQKINQDRIEYYKDIENLQVSHIQIASKDPEVFEYAIEQVRNHVARIYAEYMLSCKKIWDDFLMQYDNDEKVDILKELKRDILIQKIVVKPML